MKIETESEYRTALAEADKLIGRKLNEEELDRLGVLVSTIRDYEDRHYKIEDKT